VFCADTDPIPVVSIQLSQPQYGWGSTMAEDGAMRTVRDKGGVAEQVNAMK
jgi:hypothetical protein